MSDSAFNLIVTPENNQELRLDSWLTSVLTDYSRSRLQKLITEGQVIVNNQLCTEKKTKLKLNDRITITIPKPTSLELIPEAIDLDILYEDDCLIIINKPVGMVVHPSPGHFQGTLVHALLNHCPLAAIGGVHRPGIVHRLDKDTSGAIVVAKTDFAHQHLQAQLKAKTARREYLGVVYGSPKDESGTISQPIGRHPVDRQKNAIVPESQGGRIAVTHWYVQERLGNYTLMRFELETGRTHQIRVHSLHIGHPLVGDPVYSNGKSIGINLPGQALHAHKLELIHPITQKPLCVTASVPTTFQKLLQLLQQRHQSILSKRHTE